MPAMPAANPPPTRRADDNERFVAFAFAGADLMAEVETDGCITYATGAFRSRFGHAPEAFVGRPVDSLIAPADHEAVASALGMLAGRGRLLPMMVRLSDPARTQLALAGIALPAQNRPTRLCLTFTRPPEPAPAVLGAGTPHSFARATEARMRAGTACELGLLEIAGPGSAELLAGDAIGLALEVVAPNAVAGELSPGRYGLLDAGNTATEIRAMSLALETMLRGQGMDVQVTARHLALVDSGLTLPQATRALRHALNIFAREGGEGVVEAGLGQGLSGYLQQAGRKADALRRAIRAEGFNLMFQPIVSLTSRVPHHFEALIRPRPIPNLPLPGPQEFVMLVEALGLAGELDLCVARLACEAALGSGQKVAFNMSGQSVQDRQFREQLIALLADHPAHRSALVMVEMTETAEIENLDEAVATAEALRGIGVPFCLDDFGAGTADMRLLRALAANVVKLDGSYIPGVARSGRERAFVAGMVEIARAVGAEIVAERVETEAEATTLQGLGVHYGQGWLFGRPAPLPGMDRKLVAMRKGETESWG